MVQPCELDSVGNPFALSCLGSSRVVALVVWFVVDFPADTQQGISLDTGPLSASGPTHWQQTRLQLSQSIEVHQGGQLLGRLDLLRGGGDGDRGLRIRLQNLRYLAPERESEAVRVLTEQTWCMNDIL